MGESTLDIGSAKNKFILKIIVGRLNGKRANEQKNETFCVCCSFASNELTLKFIPSTRLKPLARATHQPLTPPRNFHRWRCEGETEKFHPRAYQKALSIYKAARHSTTSTNNIAYNSSEHSTRGKRKRHETNGKARSAREAK